MKLYNITFSPTGGTQKVADLLCQGWDREIVPVDLTDRRADFSSYAFTAQDVCVVSVPSYGGLVPGVALERLKKMQGGGAMAVLVAVYGNRAFEDTLVQLRDALLETGFRVLAGVAAIAEHSIMHQFGAGRPDAQDADQLAAFAAAIRARLQEAEPQMPAFPGNVPYKEFHVIPMFPHADKHCIGCGQCADVCPVGAIPMDKPNETDNSKCIACMRCISVCPEHSRKLNPLILAGATQKLKKACSDRKENELFL